MVGCLLNKLGAGLLAVPRLKHGRRVAANHDAALAIGADLAGGVDQRLAKEQRRAGWGDDLVYERGIGLGRFDNGFAWAADLVATGDADRAAVVRS